jgi:arginine N-succinyltransferase
MHVLRPIREDDLPALIALARSIDGGLTTLPPDDAFLQDRIEESLHAFRPRVARPGAEFYLFVLEDTATGAVVGTSGIAARVGGFDPFYSYEVRPERFIHPPLRIDKSVPVLHLRAVHAGPSEIGSLFLRSDQRRGGLGRLLSLARFLFMADQPKRFAPTVIAELRGYVDAQGRSPFWEAVGRKFFEHDFYTADALSGLGNKQFIADLMPRHPIYVTLLPPEVQAVVGKVHHETQPALALLQQEGFTPTNEVDIFDAGPQLRAEVADLRIVRELQRLPLARSPRAVPAGAGPWIVARPGPQFRATLATVAIDSGHVWLAPPVIEALQLAPGATVLVAPLRPGSGSPPNPSAP